MSQLKETSATVPGSAAFRQSGPARPAFDARGSRVKDFLDNQIGRGEIMPPSDASIFVPDDPRHGLDRDQVREFFRATPAAWAIVCWDRPGSAEARAAHRQAQRDHVARLGDRVIAYGHIVSDADGQEIATTYFVQLEDREAAEAFAGDPLAGSGAYERVEIRRWAGSFPGRQADYARKGQLLYFLMGSKIPETGPLFERHWQTHENYLRAYQNQFVVRGALRSDDGAANVGTALVIEVPSALAMEDFWKNEPFNFNGGYRDDVRIHRWIFGD